MNQDRQGELLILLGAIFWGLFPVITILSLNYLSPLASLAWSTLCSIPVFALILGFKKNWKEITDPSALRDILLMTFFTGILYYVLLFSGLRHTSAGNAGIIALTEVFFSFLLFHVWHKDYISKGHIIGSCLMLLGAIVVLYPNLTEFKIGDILILLAAFIAPFGNFFQQRARKKVSSETILFVRSLIATPFLFAIAYVFGQTSTLSGVRESVFLLLLNGLVLFGFTKILWVEGIHRISVTKANALSSINPLVTLLFAWLLLSNVPTVWQILSLAPMISGLILLGINKRPVEEKIYN